MTVRMRTARRLGQKVKMTRMLWRQFIEVHWLRTGNRMILRS